MTEAELDALQEGEMLDVEEKDVNATESDEIDRLFSEMAYLSEMIEASSSDCVEDASGPDPEPEEDLDYNATEVTVPCGDEVEIEELEVQLSELQIELTNFLDTDEDGSGGFDGLGSVYDKYAELFHQPGDINAIPDEILSKDERKAAFKTNVKKAKEHNTKAMAARAKNRAKQKKEKTNQGKAKGKTRNVATEEEESTHIEAINKWSDVPSQQFDEIYYASNTDMFAQGYDEEEASGTMVGRRELLALSSDHERRQLTEQTSFTWKAKPQMGRVVNQGSCGSCYLNAVVTEVETAVAIATGENPLSLSREQIKNCQKENYKTTSSSPRGCNGGWPSKSYEYVRENWMAPSQSADQGGLTLDTHYPYVASNKVCGYARSSMPPRAIVGQRSVSYSSHTYIQGSEENFKAALLKGPLVVALGASAWGGYKSGVFTCGSRQYSINHAVTLVGWGVHNNGQKYWEIQNSWGTWWGEGGFMKIHRGLEADGSDKASRGARGDKGCGMTYYGAWQSKLPKKFDSNAVDCQGSFGSWSTCSENCEGGYETQTYTITQQAAHGGQTCSYLDNYKKTRNCKRDEVVQQDWGQCDTECNGGMQYKMTTVTPSHAGTTCAVKTHERACNTHLCPNTCLVVKDGPYSWVNGHYHPKVGTNPRSRCSDAMPYFEHAKTHKWYGKVKVFWYARSCQAGYWLVYNNVGSGGWMWSNYLNRGTTPLGVNGKWRFGDRNGMKITALNCDELPQDCEYTWPKDWEDCSASCDGGTSVMNPMIIAREKNGGKVCPAAKTKTCNTHSCSAKCMEVKNAKYSFLNGQYEGVVEGYKPSFCGGQETYPRYTKTIVKKYWWRTYTYTYDLAFSNNRCSYKYNGRNSNPRYTRTQVGGYWALGRVYTWGSRVSLGSWDRSPYSWSKYIKSTDSVHPKNMAWADSATQASDWYKKGATSVTEVACTS